MKFFGEYLVEKKVITPEQLVDALVKQIAQTPAICEIVFSEKLLSAEQLMLIFNHQARARSGFVDAAQAVGAWSSELAAQVESQLQQRRVPLGQFLIQSGALRIDQLGPLLDDFLAEVPEAPAPTSDSTPASAVAPTPASASELVAAPEQAQAGTPAQELSPELESVVQGMEELLDGQISNSAALANYAEMVTEQKKGELEQLFEFIGTWEELKGNDQRGILTVAYEGLHAFRGAARFANAAQSEQLIAALEEPLKKLVAVAQPVAKEIFPKLAHLGKDSVELFWKMRDSILTNQSEQPCLQEEKNKTQFTQLVKEATELSASLP